MRLKRSVHSGKRAEPPSLMIAVVLIVAVSLAQCTSMESNWVKQTEAVDMVTAAAISTLGYRTSVAPVEGSRPALFLKRLAGDGMIVEGANPSWIREFWSNNAWVAVDTTKYVVAYVGTRLLDARSRREVTVIVEWRSLDDHTFLPEGYGSYTTPVQDPSLYIVDAHERILILNSPNGGSIRFDLDSRTFTNDAVASAPSWSLGRGQVYEESPVDLDTPRGAFIFETWIGQIGPDQIEVMTGQIENEMMPTSTPDHGVLFIRRVNPGPLLEPVPVEQIDYQTARGPLRVFAVIESVIVTVDGGGVPFAYDLDQRRIVAADDLTLTSGPFYDLNQGNSDDRIYHR